MPITAIHLIQRGVKIVVCPLLDTWKNYLVSSLDSVPLLDSLLFPPQVGPANRAQPLASFRKFPRTVTPSARCRRLEATGACLAALELEGVVLDEI
jgi:hypothetical protein